MTQQQNPLGSTIHYYTVDLNWMKYTWNISRSIACQDMMQAKQAVVNLGSENSRE